uniref:Lysosomal dipeptide transporter MFSD1 n=1 Tax=Amphimedon queenslandica TaxID=400682 RepID=A0A1X7UK92_AMPQE
MGNDDLLEQVKTSAHQSTSYGSIPHTKDSSSLCEYITDPSHWPFHGISLLMVSFIYFSSYVCVESQGGLEVPIIKVMNIDTTRYSLLLVAFSSPNVLFCLVGGVIVDRALGHKLSLILVVAMTGVGQFLMGLGAFLDHFWLMIVGRMFIGVGNEMTDVVSVALASKKQNATFRMSLYYTAAKLGGSSSLAVSQYIYEQLRFIENPSYRLGSTLLVGVMLMMMAFVISIILFFLDMKEEKVIKRERQKISMIRWNEIKNFPMSFWICVAEVSIFCGGVIVFTAIGQDFYTKKYSLTPFESGAANSLVFLATIAVAPIIGCLINRLGRHSFCSVVGMLAALSAHLTILCSSNSFYIPYLASTVYSVSYALIMPSLYTIPCLLIQPNKMATAYGFIHSGINLYVAVMSVISVYYPTVPGSYVPLVFVPGLFGWVYEELYSDVLHRITSHGYILVGVDLHYPGYGTSSDDDATLLKLIDWLIADLNDKELTLHGDPGVKADWTLLGLMGHSAGNDNILKVIERNETLAKAVSFIEPMSYSFEKELSYSLPSLCYGTQYSEENPKCIYADFDYRHFYNKLHCPRIQMSAVEYGHCDILNDSGWELCHVSHSCKTNTTNDRVLYHRFISGLITGFFGYYLQDSPPLLSYLTNLTNIPVALENFKYDIKC